MTPAPTHPARPADPASAQVVSAQPGRRAPAAAAGMSLAEIAVRRDLAACYRLADYFGWSDIVWNHITARVPGADNHFLIMEMGLRYDEVTAGNLLKVDQRGELAAGTGRVNKTGFVIHGGIYAARAEVNFILHTHTRAGMAVSVLKEGLTPLVNDVAPLHGMVAYHDFEGVSTDAGENARIVAALGERPAMILRNHGLLTAGAGAGEAFMLMYYLERACQVQMDALSSGREIQPIAPGVLAEAAERYRDFRYGQEEWPALLRLAEERFPDYKQL